MLGFREILSSLCCILLLCSTMLYSIISCQRFFSCNYNKDYLQQLISISRCDQYPLINYYYHSFPKFPISFLRLATWVGCVAPWPNMLLMLPNVFIVLWSIWFQMQKSFKFGHCLNSLNPKYLQIEEVSNDPPKHDKKCESKTIYNTAVFAYECIQYEIAKFSNTKNAIAFTSI